MTIIDFHTHQPTAEGVVSPRSFGIHPWQAGGVGEECYDAFYARYRDAFEDCQIVGECGLDKVRGPRWDCQERLLEWQLRVAADLRKPVVLHCVRAYGELLRVWHGVAARVPCVVHGFSGSPQLAAQLCKAGIFVSFGAALLDARRAKVAECLRTIDTPFLLETDDSTCGIAAVYDAAARIRQVDVAALADTIKATYLALFAV